MKILLIGYGAVGEVLVRLLVNKKEIERIVCLDYIEKMIIKNDKVSFIRFDMSNKNAFFEFLKKHKFDLIINTTIPRFNLLIMEGCLRAKSNYMDLASMWDPDPSGKPWSPELGIKLKSPYRVEEFDYKNKYEKAQFGFVIELTGWKNNKKEKVRYSVMFPNQGQIDKLGLNANFI